MGENPEKSTKNEENGKTDENEKLTRLAIDEILQETARAAVRADKIGPTGWLPCPLRKTNKRFLATTLKTTISHNSRISRQANKRLRDCNGDSRQRTEK